MANSEKTKVTQARLKELLHYDVETGLFSWLVDKSRTAKAGQRAGSLKANGYVHVFVDGTRYLAHRLAWLYVHGAWPTKQIDHIDRSRSNNALDNLRDVCGSLNGLNQAARDNKTGYTGVYWHPKASRFYAQVSIDGKNKHLGMFDSVEEAATARKVAADAYLAVLVGRVGFEPTIERL